MDPTLDKFKNIIITLEKYQKYNPPNIIIEKQKVAIIGKSIVDNLNRSDIQIIYFDVLLTNDKYSLLRFTAIYKYLKEIELSKSKKKIIYYTLISVIIFISYYIITTTNNKGYPMVIPRRDIMLMGVIRNGKKEYFEKIGIFN